MDFEDAIKALKNGHRVKREDWGGFWYLPGGYVPVSLHMADMLADDWVDLDDKELEDKKEDFYYFLQDLNHDIKIIDVSNVSGTHPQYTVKIKDKYIRFDLGTHSYYLTDTAEYNSFSDSSFLSSDEVIESLKYIFEISNYSFDSDDISICIATQKSDN